MTPYRVVVVGMGKRGRHHAAAFKKNPRFELAAICSRNRTRLEEAAAELGSVRTGSDPLAVAQEVRPDVFCFCTPPRRWRSRRESRREVFDSEPPEVKTNRSR